MKYLFSLILMLGLLGVCPQARASYDLLVPEEDSLFQLHILENGETNPFWGVEAVGEIDESTLSCLRAGLGYWVRVLAPQAVNRKPVSILLFHNSGDSAGALSVPVEGFEGLTFLAAALTLEDYEARLQHFLATTEEGGLEGVTPDTFLTAAITIGEFDWYYGSLTALPENENNFHLTATIVHELSHALGILTQTFQAESGSFFFYEDYFGLWSAGLHDMYGTQAKPGMEISLNGEEDSGKFVLANGDIYSGAYFTGTNVQEVLGEGTRLSFPESGLSEEGYEGTVPGLPVNGSENGKPELSHIELQNGLMSHQNWRNWTTFMEAELAALQDLGLKFDRKQLFGHSIYASGTENTANIVINNHGYFARENGEWVEGTPNETPLGIGLHIYGSYNDVTQVADLLTIGEEAVGIRVEGVGNKLTVAEGTRIQADGAGGSALLVSYGKEHTINLMGEATALGEGGIAARFDFGDNILGNDTEYRGSWMWTVQNELQQDILSKIDGALVKAFNVSGSLKGSAAAIYIAKNAFVEEINILTGARLEGDIISKWDPKNPNIIRTEDTPKAEDMHTELTFGLSAEEDGTAGTPDKNFSLDYSGNILGDKSIDMSLEAGRLSLSGKVDVYSLENKGYLVLNQSVTGSVVEVVEQFTNNADATLETGFAADGSVTAIEAASAKLSGTWALRPMRDYYATGAQIAPDAPVVTNNEETDNNDTFANVKLVADSSPTYATGAQIAPDAPVATNNEETDDNNTFANVKLVADSSPTLSFELTSSSATGPQVSVSRSHNAYSRLAQTSTAHSVGLAMDRIAGNATGDMQNLVEALDWSGHDGQGVARGLQALGPGAYDAAARASLSQQSEFNMLIMRRMLAQNTRRAWAEHFAGQDNSALRKKPASDWQVWATPYGAGSFQGNHAGLSSWKSEGVGLILGAERHFDSGLDFGFHAALAARRTHVQDSNEAQVDTKSAFIGLQALFAPESWDGFYFTAQGRLGIESGDMDRDVSINGYNRQSKSRWSGVAGSLQAGLGWDAHLDTEAGFVTMGPLAFFEYAFLHRPSLEENEGGAARLDVDDTLYDSLLMNLGVHAGWQTDLANGTTLGLDVLAAWRHELLDSNFSTTASFRDYGAHDFSSDSNLPGRDSLLVQAGLTLATVSDFSAQLEIGGEFFREGYTAMNLGLNLTWQF